MNADAIQQKNVHESCLLCGAKNPWSFGLKFQSNDDGSVCGKFQAHDKLQGYDGILHGGMISALLDSAMTNCLFLKGVLAVTGDLQVRFLHPVPSNALIDLRAWILTCKPPLYYVKAELMIAGRIMAWSKAKFMQHKST